MNFRFNLVLISLLFAFQQFANCQDAIESKLSAHVHYLADDKLEGRATGSKGEQLASDYIVEQFRSIGLLPIGESGKYLETFTANAGREKGEQNYFRINENAIDDKKYLVHPLSGNGLISGIPVMAGYGITAPLIQYDDYTGIDVKGKIAVIRLGSPENDDPHSKFSDFTDERLKIKTAETNGALGVIFINEDTTLDEPEAEYRHQLTVQNIPVIFTSDKVIIAKLKNADNPHYGADITISVEMLPVTRTGHNVIGLIDNKAENTIVIGAHYDHLGYGEIEGSLYRGAPAIHNGADDNASGVSLIIELAQLLKKSDLKNNNYIIIAFSGEEMGLFGSKAFVGSDIIKNYKVNYMLNFDMVGRMDSARHLIVNGVGTSPQWKVIDQINNVDSLQIKTTESGIGPSDQTSFYLKDMPVLFFFTGTHSDYHKPSDDADKINYYGIEEVLHYTFQIIKLIDDKGKIEFTKTKDDTNDNVPKFTVTLGVVPDYAFSGKGMRIDGITDGRPASKAGLLSGDVVIKLGTNDVEDMTSYMQALSKFKKGDKTIVTVMRNNTTMEFNIQF